MWLYITKCLGAPVCIHHKGALYNCYHKAIAMSCILLFASQLNRKTHKKHAKSQTQTRNCKKKLADKALHRNDTDDDTATQTNTQTDKVTENVTSIKQTEHIEKTHKRKR